MDDATVIIIICLVVFFLLIKGVVKTFKRQPIVAILCIIFLFPIYVIWAFCELFTGSIKKHRTLPVNASVKNTKGVE